MVGLASQFRHIRKIKADKSNPKLLDIGHYRAGQLHAPIHKTDIGLRRSRNGISGDDRIKFAVSHSINIVE